MNNAFLNNAPLKEVMFEIKWDLDYISEQSIVYDNGFEQAVLNFTKSCRQDFNELEILKPENIPPIAFNNHVTHRFRKVKNEYPLYQLGPGVFTVNDNNKNYKWSDFDLMIKNGIECLRKSYTKDLIPKNLQLLYVDRVSPYIFGKVNKFDFLRNHLKINAESYDFVDGELNNIQFSKSFNVNDEILLNIIVSTGIDQLSKEDVIEWKTFVSNKKRVSWDSLDDWIQKSHETCSSTFKKMVSNELYEYFGS
tara:strand:- start:28 stop:780 length:753 start_codon:yes stop_codon:yes gene_type:complete